MEPAMIKRALQRHLGANNLRPYEQVLQSVTSRGDIWATSQGEYMAWWLTRRAAPLKVWASDGQIAAETDLEGAVLNWCPDRFFPSGATTACGSYDGPFTGEVQIVVDATLQRKELLIDALQREGILNHVVGQGGPFLLSHELDPLLEEMEDYLCQRKLRQYNQNIVQVRDAVAAMLAEQGLPLIRVWYHPQVNGRVTRAVFSPRYDVDRAITNMPKIVRLEDRYDVSSTLYIRTDQPFYGDREIAALCALCGRHEIGLHAEFATHAARYGGELAAAQAERAHLERVIGHPVIGLALHGGELTSNKSESTEETIECCGFCYDASHGPTPYYLPYRRLDRAGRFENTYHLRCHFGDIHLHTKRQKGSANGGFYEQLMASLDEVVQHNGILVPLLHPEYFGFWEYLCRPRNLARFARFLPTYLSRVITVQQGQQALAAGRAQE